MKWIIFLVVMFLLVGCSLDDKSYPTEKSRVDLQWPVFDSIPRFEITSKEEMVYLPRGSNVYLSVVRDRVSGQEYIIFTNATGLVVQAVSSRDTVRVDSVRVVVTPQW